MVFGIGIKLNFDCAMLEEKNRIMKSEITEILKNSLIMSFSKILIW